MMNLREIIEMNRLMTYLKLNFVGTKVERVGEYIYVQKDTEEFNPVKFTNDMCEKNLPFEWSILSDAKPYVYMIYKPE